MGGLNAMTAATIAGAFVFGMVLTLLGSIKLALAKEFGIDEARVGWLVSALNLALIPAMLLSGFLIDRWDARPVLILGSVLTAMGLYSLTLRKTFGWALLSVLLIGLGGACVSTSSVVLMPRAFFGHEQTAASLNLGMVFFGLGSLMTTSLADLLLRTVRFRWTLGLLALVCLVPAGIAAAPFKEEVLLREPSESVGIFTNPGLWLAGLVLLLYMPLEFAVGTWATTYLTDRDYRDNWAAWLLSGFWLTFLASRLGMAFLEHSGILPAGGGPWMIVFLGILAAVALGHLVGASTRGNAGLGLLLLGAILGPIFPTLVGLVFRQYPAHQHGTAYGTLFAIGSVGGLILPPIIGTYARRRGVQKALKIPLFQALLLSAIALVLALANLQFVAGP
jgi:fucose permease